MKITSAAAIAVLMATALAQRPVAQSSDVSAQARQIHTAAIVIDTHDDTAQRLLFEPSFDIGKRDAKGSIDIPRMREGGLDAIVFSIWSPGDLPGPVAVKRALQQIDRVRETVRLHSNDLVLATSAADIQRAAAGGRIAVLLGMEGGHQIDSDLGVLRTYATLGVKYLTLTHSVNTPWADSSGDKPAHNGLTPFGKDVVRELNRLGVMVDVSHVADKTFFDTLEVTRVPVIASHSSARALANAPRNLTDDMLRALSRNGGVAMVNYNAGFLGEAFRAAPRSPAFRARVDAATKACGDNEACSIQEEERIEQEAMRSGELPAVTWEAIVDHIDHIAKVAGIDHVGLGSDFDGATMPLGMEDVSKLPRLTDALLKRGYSPADVEKVLGRNLLRVLEQVDANRER